MTNFNEHLKLSTWNYQIMELQGEALIIELKTYTRQTIITWLQWNDPNGIYEDKLSLKEFGKVLTLKEEIEIILRQIKENH